MHDNKNINFTIEFEVETHEKTDPPVITVVNKNFVLSNGICKVDFVCESANGFDIVWQNKTGSDTLCDQNGNIIADKNLKRGEWRLGRVSKTEMGTDGHVRRITVAYKNKNSNIFTTVERAAQRVVVILPKEEQ